MPSVFSAIAPAPRVDWKVERDRVDLARVATGLLGPAVGRRGERGRRFWWPCPFHEDANPSFCVDPGSSYWKCHGCGEHGDAANLVMRLEGVGFPEAVRKLAGGGPFSASIARRPEAPAKPKGPSGLPFDEALALVEGAEAALWSEAGSKARAYLAEGRHLAEGSIRSARLGWTSRTELPTSSGGRYVASGVVIPWFDAGRLALVKVRQPDGIRPKYAEAFRDRPGAYMASGSILPGLPLVVVEGEFDAMLLGQELAGVATVVTLGGASERIGPDVVSRFLGASPWFVATDADTAGDRAAESWTFPRAIRTRPPRPFKDWTEAKAGGVDLRRWWAERMAGISSPDLFAWPDLAALRWGPADKSSDGGVVVARPSRDRLASLLETEAANGGLKGEAR